AGLAAYPPVNLGQLALQSGGHTLTVILNSSAGPDTQADQDLGAIAALRWPIFGNQSARLNAHSWTASGDNNPPNVNLLSQVFTIGASDVDPADGLAHMRMTVAPIVQNAPGHMSFQQPYVFVQYTNLTRSNSVLYQKFFTYPDVTLPWQAVVNGANT